MSYSRRKIQEVAYRLYSRYQHLFVDNVEGNWAAISVLDDIPLEWVKIWEEDSENLGPGESLADIQEENRILHLGFAIEIGESWADEELNEETRRRVVEKELRDLRDLRALQEVLDAEEGDIPEDEESDSEDEAREESPNGERTAWLSTHAQQSGNDDEDWGKEADERLERISFFENFVDR